MTKPTTKQLLIALINGDPVYTEDNIQIKLDEENLVHSLYTFINSNDYINDRYIINTDLYRLHKEEFQIWERPIGVTVRSPYPTQDELRKAERDNPGYSAIPGYGCIYINKILK